MPEIKNLIKNVKPTKEEPKKEEKELQTINANGVGEFSLIESNEVDTTDLALPSFLAEDKQIELANPMGTEYLGFADKRAEKSWATVSAAGVPDGSPYIVKNGQITALPVIEYFLLVGSSFLTHMHGPDMKIMYASTDITEQNPDPKHRQAHYVALLIVDVKGVLTPIRGDFRGTKTNAIENAFRALKDAAKPDWISKSDAHKVTAAFPKPFGRVYHSMTTYYDVSKSTGFGFYATKGNSLPSSPTMMQRLYDAFKNPEFTKELDASHQSYLTRVSFLNEAAAKFKS